jgi:hypothetical protein
MSVAVADDVAIVVEQVIEYDEQPTKSTPTMCTAWRCPFTDVGPIVRSHEHPAEISPSVPGLLSITPQSENFCHTVTKASRTVTNVLSGIPRKS